MSLAVCIACYSLYAKFLVPIIEGPPNLVQREILPPEVDPPSNRDHATMLTELLPQDAWEHGPCKTLVTDSGTILFQDFEPVEGGFLEVFPFTLLVIGQPEVPASETKTPPTILRCLRGARLKFDRPATEIFNGKAKLESARLVGHVDIMRPATDSASDDSLQISTSNVQIDEQKIFTIDPVSFSFGPHQGQGKNLLIEFARDPSVNLITGDFSSIIGVKRMELAFLDWLRIAARKTNQVQTDFNAPPPAGSGLDDPLAIRCAGPFVFEMDRGVASFSDDVTVESESSTRERITCDQLTLHFEKPKPNAVANSKSPMPGMKLNQLIATGSPAVVFSPTRATKITGDILSYDLQTSQVVAHQANPHGKPATIITPQHQLAAPKFTYQMMTDQPAENRQSNSIGPIKATGPGKMLRVADKTKPEFLVYWREQLSVSSELDQMLVTLTGGCGVQIGTETTINAGQLQLWLKPSKTETTNETTLESAYGEATQTAYQPTKLIATNVVEIDSLSLVGMTQQLVATWPLESDVAAEQNVLGSANSRTDASTLTRHAVNRIATLQITDDPSTMPATAGFQPIRRESSVWRDTSSQRDEPMRRDNQVTPTQFAEEISVGQKKYFFRANSVDLKLSLRNGESSIRELIATGQVALAELPANTARNDSATPIVSKNLPTDSPLTVEGESLTLLSQAEQQVRLLVRGTSETAATVTAQALRLSGTELHLDQAANKLWVDGAGQIHIKNAATTKQSDPQQSISAAPSSNYETVTVTWKSGMVFDGHKVYFEEGVEMTAQGENDERNSLVTSASSAGLSLQLKQPFDFRNLDSKKKSPAVEMEEVILVDRIIDSRRVFAAPTNPLPANQSPPTSITHQTFSVAGELLEQQKFVTSQATFNAATGKLNAAGPGVILHHARGKSPLLKNAQNSDQPANDLPSATAQNVEIGRPVGSDSALTFVRVNFDRSVDADTNSKEMLLQGNVRTLYSTVKTFDEILDPDQTAALPLDSVQVTCDQLKLAQWTQRNATKPTQELLASGNAHIIGTAFEATADRINYNQATDMLVVEGTPRSDANLWFKPTPDARQRDHLVAGKILYRLSDQWTEIQSVKNIGINRN